MTDVNPDLIEALRSLDAIDMDELSITEEPSTAEPVSVAPDADDEGVVETEPVAESEGGVEGPPSETPTSSDVGEGEHDGSPPAVPPGPPSPTELFVDLYRDTYGTEPTPEAVVEMVGLTQQLRALTPEQREAIGQIVAGQPVQPMQPIPNPAPMQPFPNPVPVQPINPPTQLPAPNVIPEAASLPPLPEYVEPEVRAALEAQQAQIAALTAQTTQATTQAQALAQAQAQAQLQAERQASMQAITEAEVSWRSSYPELSEADIQRITFKAGQSGPSTYPTLLAQHGGDHTAATHALLNVTLAGLPDIHERVNQLRVQAAADRAVADQTRKQKASALSGGSSATPKTRARTQRERDQEAIREIAALEFGAEL